MVILKFLKNLSAFQRVIIGLVLGIGSGLFLGEITGNLEIIGTAYIRLLQMTVLPYVLVSIIGGLGRLDATTAQKIGMRGGMVILFLWLLTMLTLCSCLWPTLNGKPQASLVPAYWNQKPNLISSTYIFPPTFFILWPTPLCLRLYCFVYCWAVH